MVILLKTFLLTKKSFTVAAIDIDQYLDIAFI